MNLKKTSLYALWLMSLVLVGRLTWEYTSKENKKEAAPSVVARPSTHYSGSPAVKEETSYYGQAKPQPESFVFDPNEADSTQLLRLGLTPAQVRSIYRHRAKGYSYSSKEDFSRLPFLTKGQWAHLEPLIRIGEQYQLLSPPNKVPAKTAQTDTLSSQQSLKETPRAKDSVFISRVNINRDSFKRLVNHPFLSYDQVKALKNFQRRYGNIHNMAELLVLAEFTVEDTLRLSPYVDF